MEELYCIVSGKVQGVSYRAFVLEQAQRLGLVGYVRNGENGVVEVVAQGNRRDLEALTSLLQKGPPFAAVSDLKTVWRKPTSVYKSFEVVF